jgi:hypothetical protein
VKGREARNAEVAEGHGGGLFEGVIDSAAVFGLLEEGGGQIAAGVAIGVAIGTGPAIAPAGRSDHSVVMITSLT